MQVVNISIDPVDHLAGVHDIAINEIESCIEFVVEVVLNKENAIKETDEPDDSNNRHVNSFTFLLFYISDRNLTNEVPCEGILDKNFISNFLQLSSLSLAVISPPPKPSDLKLA